MVFRILNQLTFITLGLFIGGSAMGKTGVGDWIFQVEGAGTEVEKRVAFSRAHASPDSEARPRLVIRRAKPGKPVELMITDTHDTKKDQCTYSDWKIVIDATDFPVLGYTFEPAQTELKAKLGTPKKDLWNSFRKGLNLTVEVEQKCDSSSGLANPVSYRFSLRGSNAAYKFVGESAE